MKFYLDITMLAHLHIAYGWFHAVTAALCSMNHKPKTSTYLALYRKSVLSPGTDSAPAHCNLKAVSV